MRTTLKVYLDNCVLNRPFDDQSQERIYFETQSFIILLKYIDEGKIKILNSFVIEYEISKINNIEREEKIREYLNAASGFIEFDLKITKRANELENFGFKGIDAMHVATAEFADLDYFVTCDDNILKTAVKHKEKLKTNIISLPNLVTEIIKNA